MNKLNKEITTIVKYNIVQKCRNLTVEPTFFKSYFGHF